MAKNKRKPGDLDAIRFGVGAPDDGYSAVWRVWHHKKQSDVFVAARVQAGTWKVSLHQSGICQAGYDTPHANKRGIDVKRRAWKRWKRPELERNVSIPLYLIFLRSSLRPAMFEEGRTGAPIAWLPAVPTAPAIEVAFSFIRRPAPPPDVILEKTSPLAVPVASIEELPNGESLWLWAYPAPVDDLLSQVTPETRAEMRSWQKKHLDSKAEKARGVLMGRRKDGSAFMCEVAGDQI